MTNSFEATDLPTPVNKVTARLQAAKGSALQPLADPMTVFALRTELNGGVFVEITGDRLQQIEGLPGLTKVCADRARTRWRTVAEYRPFRHDGNYVLHP